MRSGRYHCTTEIYKHLAYVMYLQFEFGQKELVSLHFAEIRNLRFWK